MRPQKISDQQLIKSMLEVIRAKGYDGSSLDELANSGGLKKASLYHRFPQGKEQLAQSVLDSYTIYLQQNVFDVLERKEVKPKKRLKTALQNISSLYAAGTANCLYRSLSLDPGIELFGDQIADSCKRWITSFTALGRDSGLKKKKARKLAKEGLLKIQGALVLAKIFNDSKPFQEVVSEISANYSK